MGYCAKGNTAGSVCGPKLRKAKERGRFACRPVGEQRPLYHTGPSCARGEKALFYGIFIHAGTARAPPLAPWAGCAVVGVAM